MTLQQRQAHAYSSPLMTAPQQIPEDLTYRFSHRHLLGIEGLSPDEITYLLDLADTYVEQNRRPDKERPFTRPHDHKPLLRNLDPDIEFIRACGQTPRRRYDEYVGRI